MKLAKSTKLKIFNNIISYLNKEPLDENGTYVFKPKYNVLISDLTTDFEEQELAHVHEVFDEMITQNGGISRAYKPAPTILPGGEIPLINPKDIIFTQNHVNIVRDIDFYKNLIKLLEDN